MQPRKPPRLYLRPRKGYPSVWVIRDGTTMISTRFHEEDFDLAQEVLDAYAEALDVKPGKASIPQILRIDGWVYFASCDHPDFPIKIGWASNVRQRLKTIQCSLPYKAILLAATRGSLEDEARFHIGFNQYRLEGEWFARSPELMALIERCSVKEAA